MINDIERIVEKAPTFQESSKNSKQIREELQEVDEIVQEFMKRKNLHGNKDKNKNLSQEVNDLEVHRTASPSLFLADPANS